MFAFGGAWGERTFGYVAAPCERVFVLVGYVLGLAQRRIVAPERKRTLACWKFCKLTLAGGPGGRGDPVEGRVIPRSESRAQEGESVFTSIRTPSVGPQPRRGDSRKPRSPAPAGGAGNGLPAAISRLEPLSGP